MSLYKDCEKAPTLQSIHKVCWIVNSLNLYSTLICVTFEHVLQLRTRSLKGIFSLRINIQWLVSLNTIRMGKLLH